ncbi:hypothetical protein FPSE_05755 [Fusarium pseudograminearum CS3096]|uniref:Uncharacterized protein n=1 Tax=Fusarium pseudograminearum (strain CS3096) TaxID=1028729 RepID=K3VIE0_FUSPC|nr:hypothetical protein FPSE_05755 [Fusarium pseudograminearum CS3096]EKJ74064.1 hypothetical protein FPSE_05755 [Fusarium pseudograminearum CS3096]
MQSQDSVYHYPASFVIVLGFHHSWLGITVSTEVLSREGNDESALILVRNQEKTKRSEAIVRTRLHCLTQAKVVDTDKSATGHQQKTKDGQTVPCRNVKAGAGDPGNCPNRKHQNKTCRMDVCALDEYGITSSVDPESKNKYGRKNPHGRLPGLGDTY